MNTNHLGTCFAALRASRIIWCSGGVDLHSDHDIRDEVEEAFDELFGSMQRLCRS